MQEHASVVVETVTKTSTTTQFRGIQRFQSDASKVTAKGAGLTKAVKGKTATFTVDASRAGECMGSSTKRIRIVPRRLDNGFELKLYR